MKHVIASIAVILAAASGYAGAQSFPIRPVRLISPFPPGGFNDILSRLVGQKLTESWGQQVVVDNRPGANMIVGTNLAAKSPPDGTTLVLAALASLVTNPHLYKTVGYDTLKDLAPVAIAADLPLLLVSNPALPVKTVPELVAYAKANPDKLSHPSSGNGTLSHLGMEDLKRRAGITILNTETNIGILKSKKRIEDYIRTQPALQAAYDAADMKAKMAALRWFMVLLALTVLAFVLGGKG